MQSQNQNQNQNQQDETESFNNLYSLKLKLSTIAKVKNISNQYQITQDELVAKAIDLYAHHLATTPIK